jgi:hypothetical protein
VRIVFCDLVHATDPTPTSAEPAEPGTSDRVQPVGPQLVDAFPPSHDDGDQAGLLKDPQVLRGGGPGAVEARRDRAGGHFAAAGVQHGQDRPPGPVREGAEDRVEIV